MGWKIDSSSETAESEHQVVVWLVCCWLVGLLLDRLSSLPASWISLSGHTTVTEPATKSWEESAFICLQPYSTPTELGQHGWFKRFSRWLKSDSWTSLYTSADHTETLRPLLDAEVCEAWIPFSRFAQLRAWVFDKLVVNMAESFKVMKLLLCSSGCIAHNEMYVTHLVRERRQFECVGGASPCFAQSLSSFPLVMVFCWW